MKDALRQKWNKWLLEGQHIFTPAGNMRAPTLDITSWIDEAWRELNPKIIKTGFLKCSISNAMDGSEDCESTEESCDESESCVYYLNDDLVRMTLSVLS